MAGLLLDVDEGSETSDPQTDGLMIVILNRYRQKLLVPQNYKFFDQFARIIYHCLPDHESTVSNLLKWAVDHSHETVYALCR